MFDFKIGDKVVKVDQSSTPVFYVVHVAPCDVNDQILKGDCTINTDSSETGGEIVSPQQICIVD